jgi:hypothetical protein
VSAAVIVTMAGLAVLVLALAGYLVVIVWMLARINSALGTVLARVQAFAQQAQPLDRTLGDVRDDIASVVEILREAGPGSPSGRQS